MLETLVAEIGLIPDQKHHYRTAEYTFQVAVNEFHGASVSVADRMVFGLSVSLFWAGVKSNLGKARLIFGNAHWRLVTFVTA